MRAVELAGFLLERRADLLVRTDVFARRRGDLDEKQLVDHVVMAGEQPFERVDPFGQPLAVIEPVDADRDRAFARAAAEPLLRSPGDLGFAERHEFGMVDTDGKGACDGALVADADRAAVLVDLGAMLLAAIVKEAFEPFDRLEADDVIAKHRGDEPLVMRERNEQAGRRPGDMQE